MSDAHHDHDHDHDHREVKDASRLISAFAVIAVFMVIEIVGGVLAGSLALLADATHMFADAAALGLAAGAHVIARRPADQKRHFGYQRAQVLAAFFNGATLVVLTLWIVTEAIQRFFNPVEINTVLMLGVSAAGLLANTVAFGLLHSSGSQNVNIRGALLHVASDLLSSLAAIVAAVMIMTTGIVAFDPILSIFVAIMVAISGFRLLKETGHILLEGAPQNIDVERLMAGVKAFAPGVEDVHDVRIWQITPDSSSLTLHARIADTAAAEVALDRIKSYLEKEFGIRQSTVQIEIGGDCPDCEENGRHANGDGRARADAPALDNLHRVANGHDGACDHDHEGDILPHEGRPQRTALAGHK